MHVRQNWLDPEKPWIRLLDCGSPLSWRGYGVSNSPGQISLLTGIWCFWGPWTDLSPWWRLPLRLSGCPPSMLSQGLSFIIAALPLHCPRIVLISFLRWWNSLSFTLYSTFSPCFCAIHMNVIHSPQNWYGLGPLFVQTGDITQRKSLMLIILNIKHVNNSDLLVAVCLCFTCSGFLHNIVYRCLCGCVTKPL